MGFPHLARVAGAGYTEYPFSLGTRLLWTQDLTFGTEVCSHFEEIMTAVHPLEPTPMSAEAKSSGRVPVQLDWAKRDGVIVVTPRDQDRFTIRIESAIETLVINEGANRFRKQMDLLFRNLANWLSARPDVMKAYVTIRDGELAFVVMHNSSTYDETFEDELSNLDIELANDPDLREVEINVFSLPPVSDEVLDSFLHSEVQFAFESEGGRAPTSEPS